MPQHIQELVRRYFSGRSFFDACGNEYKVFTVYFELTMQHHWMSDDPTMHTRVLIDYNFIAHSHRFCNYLDIQSMMEHIINVYFYPDPCLDVIFPDEVINWASKQKIMRGRIDEDLNAREFIPERSNLPNLFYKAFPGLEYNSFRFYRRFYW